MTQYSRLEARQLKRLVTNAEGRFPEHLTNLLDAANEVHATKPTPRNRYAALLDTAAAGNISAAKISDAVAKTANHSAQDAHTQQAQIAVERAIMVRFRQELINGGADQILDNLRPNFNTHIAGIRAAAQRIDPSITPEAFLATADAESLHLWQTLPQHISALNAIAAVTDHFTHNGEARIIKLLGDPGPHLIDRVNALQGAALYCTGDDLDPMRVRSIWRTNGPHRQTAWFPLSSFAQLRTVAEAHERLRAWCEANWQVWEDDRVATSTRLVDGKTVPVDSIPNPFALAEQPA